MAGHGGGAWKVAYADFVTAMMAFFLVMWITAQSPEVKQSISNYFNDPFAIPSDEAGSASAPPGQGPGTGKNVERSKEKSGKVVRKHTTIDSATVKNANQLAISRKKIDLLVLHDGKNIVKGTAVFFPEFSADLDAEGKNQLEKTAKKIFGLPNKIEIRGHSTRRPLPSGSPFRDSWQLAYARCLASMEYLMRLGIEPERIRLSQAGPFEPQTIRTTPDWEKQNSRVEVYLLDELANDLVGTIEERNERFQTKPKKEAGAK